MPADVVDRARAIAERARSAQGAPTAEPEPFRASFWTVWPADGDALRVLFCPPQSRDGIRTHFYPHARSIVDPSEEFEVRQLVAVEAARFPSSGKWWKWRGDGR